MKTTNLLLVITFILLLGLTLVYSQTTATNIQTQNIKSSFDKETKITTYMFNSTNGALKIGKNDYWHIKPSANANDSFIKVDENGTIIEANFTTDKYGATYMFGNDKIYVPANTNVRFIRINNFLVLDIPAGSKLEKFPEYNLTNKNISARIVRIAGQNLTLPNGLILNKGYINSEKGKIFPGYESVINHIEFNEADLELFFDGKKQNITSSYVSLNPNEKNLYYSSNRSSMLDFIFLEGNPFVNVKNGDLLALQSSHFKKLEIQVTNPKDKITNFEIINYSLKGGGSIFLTNGKKNFVILSNNIIAQKSSYPPKGLSGGFVPISIEASSGENPLMKKDSKIIIFDDGRWTIYSPTKDASENSKYLTKAYHEKIYSLEESPERIQKTISDTQSKFPSFKFENLELLTSDKINIVKQSLNELTPQMRSSLGGLTFRESPTEFKMEQNDLGEFVYQSFAIGGEAFAYDRSILIASNSNSAYIPHVITHETAHKLHFNLGSDSGEFAEQWAKVQPKEDYRTEKEQLLRYTASGGYEYGFEKWSSTVSNQPLNGFIRVYSAGNNKEDVATFVDTIYTDPQIFKKYSLLDPKSPNYADGKYQKKLDLLLKYGFISKSQYDLMVAQ